MEYFGYLDAGTGSIFFQTILGAVLAGGVIFRHWIKKISIKLKTVLSQTAKNDKE